MPRINRVLSDWSPEVQDYFISPSASVIESWNIGGRRTLSFECDYFVYFIVLTPL